jgi:hypothetical protein
MRDCVLVCGVQALEGESAGLNAAYHGVALDACRLRCPY